MNNGWIKLHRKILENPIHLKGEWFSVWIHMLLMASHEEHTFIWNGKKQIIKPGQLLTGRLSLSSECGVSPSLVERVLKYLETEQQIVQHKTTKHRVITILNWDKYQDTKKKSDNKRTTSGQQADTYKNVNKVKNDKNNTIAEASSAGEYTFKGYIKKLEDSPRRELNIIALYLDERKPNIQNLEQMRTAVKRHLRSAKDLVPFTNEQILNAIPKAKDLTSGWTIETLIKVLTK